MNTGIPVVGTIIPVDRYHYVTVRTEDGLYETWLLTENDIGRGKSQRSTKLPAFGDDSFDAIRATQHLRGAVHRTIADGLPDPRAADALAIVHHRGDRHDFKSSRRTRLPQQCDATLAGLAETPVLAHGQRGDVSFADQPLKKVLRAHFRKGAVEFKREQEGHVQPS